MGVSKFTLHSELYLWLWLCRREGKVQQEKGYIPTLQPTDMHRSIGEWSNLKETLHLVRSCASIAQSLPFASCRCLCTWSEVCAAQWFSTCPVEVTQTLRGPQGSCGCRRESPVVWVQWNVNGPVPLQILQAWGQAPHSHLHVGKPWPTSTRDNRGCSPWGSLHRFPTPGAPSCRWGLRKIWADTRMCSLRKNLTTV